MALLDPKLDVVFKLLFGRVPSLLASLVESVLQSVSPMTSVELLNPILTRALIADKDAILDLHVRLADRHHADVEMQRAWRPGLPERAVFYGARMCTSQLRPGDRHQALSRSTVVFLLGESKLDEPPHAAFGLRERVSHRTLSDALDIHFVDMPRCALAPRDGTMLQKWCRFFMASSSEELEALAMEDPVMSEAVQTLTALSADSYAQQLAEAREKGQIAKMLDLGKATREGLERGREEGLERGREEGLERGREEGLERGRLEAIEAVAELLGLPLDAWRRERLSSASAHELEALLVQLRTLRRWPD